MRDESSSTSVVLTDTAAGGLSTVTPGVATAVVVVVVADMLLTGLTVSVREDEVPGRGDRSAPAAAAPPLLPLNVGELVLESRNAVSFCRQVCESSDGCDSSSWEEAVVSYSGRSCTHHHQTHAHSR